MKMNVKKWVLAEWWWLSCCQNECRHLIGTCRSLLRYTFRSVAYKTHTHLCPRLPIHFFEPWQGLSPSRGSEHHTSKNVQHWQKLVRGELGVKCQKAAFKVFWPCDAWPSNSVTPAEKHQCSHTLHEELSPALRRTLLCQKEFNPNTFWGPSKVDLHLWLTGHHPGKLLKKCFQNKGDEGDPGEMFSETLLFRFGPAHKKGGERLSQRKTIKKINNLAVPFSQAYLTECLTSTHCPSGQQTPNCK